MTISIPYSVKELVDQEVANGGSADPEAYIRALVEADIRHKAAEWLDALLLAGLSSQPRELTQQDWDVPRRRVHEHHPTS